MRKYSFFLFLGIAFLCYAFLSLFGPVFIRFLFEQGQFDLLSRLTMSPVSEPWVLSGPR